MASDHKVMVSGITPSLPIALCAVLGISKEEIGYAGFENNKSILLISPDFVDGSFFSASGAESL